MKSYPLVSVLIPLYNAERYVSETIRCCLSQTYKNIEVIVVNDNSSDASYDIVKSFESDTIHIYNSPGSGGNYARNYAFSKCKGEYIKFLDADDLMSPALIEKQMACAMKYGTHNSIVFSTLKRFYDNGIIEESLRHIDKSFESSMDLLVSMWKYYEYNCPHCHLMHRDLFIKTKGWNESVIKNQDGEFFSRVYNIADKVIFEPDENAMWRQVESGVHKEMNEAAAISALKTNFSIAKLILNYNNTEDNRKIVENYLGMVIYSQWIGIRKHLYLVDEFTSETGVKPVIPQRKIFKILSLICGERRALDLINKFEI